MSNTDNSSELQQNLQTLEISVLVQQNRRAINGQLVDILVGAGLNNHAFAAEDVFVESQMESQRGRHQNTVRNNKTFHLRESDFEGDSDQDDSVEVARNNEINTSSNSSSEGDGSGYNPQKLITEVAVYINSADRLSEYNRYQKTILLQQEVFTDKVSKLQVNATVLRGRVNLKITVRHGQQQTTEYNKVVHIKTDDVGEDNAESRIIRL